jgi:hypothetical protein
LSDKEVISKASLNYVPVALNLYEIRKRKGSAGEFYTKIAKQRPSQYQGLYVATAEGKVLASRGSQPKKGTWEADTLKMLDEGLEAFGEVTPRKFKLVDPTPERGIGVRKDGSIVLEAYVRPLTLGLDTRGRGPLVIDRVELTKAEKSSLTLAEAEEGSTWTVPEKVVGAFYRVLSPVSDSNWLARRNEVDKATLRGKVERVRKGVAYLSYTGSISGVHVFQIEPNKGKKIYADVKFRGTGTADAKTGKLLTLLLVGDGRFRNYPPYDDESKYGVVVEWWLKPE